jgi:uncharacterized repeat protein (TIGR01451 family)
MHTGRHRALLTLVPSVALLLLAGGTAVPLRSANAETVDYTVTKTAPMTVAAGGPITYTITVTTRRPLITVYLTDPMPTGITVVSVTPPNGWTCATSLMGFISAGINTVGCGISFFSQGSTVVVTIQAQVSPSVPAGSTLRNTVTMTSEVPMDSSTSNTATTTVTPAGSPPTRGIVVYDANGQPGSVALSLGCSRVAVSSPAGTPLSALAVLVQPPNSVVSLWHDNNSLLAWQAGYFASGGPTDVSSTGGGTEAYAVCVSVPATMSSG